MRREQKTKRLTVPSDEKDEDETADSPERRKGRGRCSRTSNLSTSRPATISQQQQEIDQGRQREERGRSLTFSVNTPLPSCYHRRQGHSSISEYRPPGFCS